MNDKRKGRKMLQYDKGYSRQPKICDDVIRPLEYLKDIQLMILFLLFIRKRRYLDTSLTFLFIFYTC